VFSTHYHVFSTTDGHKAIEFIGRHHMHVIISDQRMPGMTGVELLRQSREISPRSVRILLTGYSDLAAIVGSINDGEVYRFISKPWDNQALQTTVAEAVTIGLELADTKEAALTLPERMTAGVLVVDEDEEIFRVTRELLGTLCPVVHAADVDVALHVLRQQEIAVVLADVGTGGAQLAVMLKILKQEHPQVLTIVATREADAAQAIELINQAQVFRLLGKPMKVGLLKRNVHAALQRYLIYQQEPRLARVHKVDAPEQLRTSGAGMRILEELKSLRSSWFGAH
jgi:serine/threonine-protein kinase